MQASGAEFHFIFQIVVFWSNLPLLHNDSSEVIIKTIETLQPANNNELCRFCKTVGVHIRRPCFNYFI